LVVFHIVIQSNLNGFLNFTIHVIILVVHKFYHFSRGAVAECLTCRFLDLYVAGSQPGGATELMPNYL